MLLSVCAAHYLFANLWIHPIDEAFDFDNSENEFVGICGACLLCRCKGIGIEESQRFNKTSASCAPFMSNVFGGRHSIWHLRVICVCASLCAKPRAFRLGAYKRATQTFVLHNLFGSELLCIVKPRGSICPCLAPFVTETKR